MLPYRGGGYEFPPGLGLMTVLIDSHLHSLWMQKAGGAST